MKDEYDAETIHTCIGFVDVNCFEIKYQNIEYVVLLRYICMNISNLCKSSNLLKRSHLFLSVQNLRSVSRNLSHGT